MFCTRVAWACLVCLLLCKEEGSSPVSLQLPRGGIWACPSGQQCSHSGGVCPQIQGRQCGAYVGAIYKKSGNPPWSNIDLQCAVELVQLHVYETLII